jgi:hypothetical protein
MGWFKTKLNYLTPTSNIHSSPLRNILVTQFKKFPEKRNMYFTVLNSGITFPCTDLAFWYTFFVYILLWFFSPAVAEAVALYYPRYEAFTINDDQCMLCIFTIKRRVGKGQS